MEDFFFYARTYQTTILYSIFYYVPCSLVGLFIILKKSNLLSFTLTQVTHVSFLISLYLVSLGDPEIFEIIEKAHFDSVSYTLFSLDILWIVVLLILCIFIFALSLICRQIVSNLEPFWTIIIVVCIASIPLLHKLFELGEHIGYSSYFGELLYTPKHWFLRYLPALGIFLFLFMIFMRGIFVTSFDATQAYMLNMKKNSYDLLFVILATGIIGISSRVLGTYLTITALIAPAYAALSMRLSILPTCVVTAILSLLFGMIGFVCIFYFDELPSEPIFIITNTVLSLITIILSRLRRPRPISH